jgi:hypothetical protein
LSGLGVFPSHLSSSAEAKQSIMKGCPSGLGWHCRISSYPVIVSRLPESVSNYALCVEFITCFRKPCQSCHGLHSSSGTNLKHLSPTSPQSSRESTFWVFHSVTAIDTGTSPVGSSYVRRLEAAKARLSGMYFLVLVDRPFLRVHTVGPGNLLAWSLRARARVESGRWYIKAPSCGHGRKAVNGNMQSPTLKTYPRRRILISIGAFG